MSAQHTAIVWFRNDLRLMDHAVLHAPILRRRATHVLPVVCLGQRHAQAPVANRFRRESVRVLRDLFRRHFNLPLLVCEGNAEKFLPSLANRLGTSGTVLCSTEVCSEEVQELKNVRKQLPKGWQAEEIWNYSLYHIDDLPFELKDLPQPFTSMRKVLENKRNRTPVRPLLPIPKQLPPAPPQINPSDVTDIKLPPHVDIPNYGLKFVGGVEAAEQRLEAFISSGLATYKATRNGSIGWNYSSKLSPWLATGCLSPRQVYHRIKEYEAVTGSETEHTYWVIFELMWRDYMRFFAARHGTKLFHETGPAGRIPNSVTWQSPAFNALAKQKLEAWKAGRTGIPWIDGHMRELVATGFMSNRGRQNVASFLVHNLHIDWREGAEFFQYHLIDHDVTANYGNWAYIAAVADRGSRINRFNPGKQARDYDPNGKHARLWVRELSSLPTSINVHNLTPQQVPDGYPVKPFGISPYNKNADPTGRHKHGGKGNKNFNSRGKNRQFNRQIRS